jgi:Cys-tRNA(Pro) deacylase
MMEELPDGARRVQQVLTDRGSLAKVLLLPQTTATAQDAANAVGVPVAYIGKSIVFATENQVAVAVVRGDHRVDSALLARALGAVQARTLRADEVRRRTGYAIGGVSPFGLPSDIEVVVDADLEAFEWCYVAAGHPRAVVRVDRDELVAASNAKVSSIAMR